VRTAAVLPDLIDSFRRVEAPGRDRIAEGIAFYGPPAVRRLEKAVHSRDIRKAVGCIHALAAVRHMTALPTIGSPIGLEPEEKRFQINRAALEVAYGEDARTALAAVRAAIELPFQRLARVAWYLGERFEFRFRTVSQIPEPELDLFNRALAVDNNGCGGFVRHRLLASSDTAGHVSVPRMLVCVDTASAPDGCQVVRCFVAWARR
jgi:hypothetical protein